MIIAGKNPELNRKDLQKLINILQELVDDKEIQIGMIDMYFEKLLDSIDFQAYRIKPACNGKICVNINFEYYDKSLDERGKI